MSTSIDTTRKVARLPACVGVPRIAGFTLIEVMMVVAVIGILAAIALPSYRDFITRGKIPEATSHLAAKRVQMEQFFQDNRTYAGAPACTSDTGSSKFFTFSCSAVAAQTYTLQAVGTGTMASFTYTVNQSDVKTTPSVPDGWTTSTTCWITNKGGLC